MKIKGIKKRRNGMKIVFLDIDGVLASSPLYFPF